MINIPQPSCFGPSRSLERRSAFCNCKASRQPYILFPCREKSVYRRLRPWDGSQVANGRLPPGVRAETLRCCIHRRKRVSPCISSIDRSLLILEPRTYALFLIFSVDSRATLSCLVFVYLVDANLFQFRSILFFLR